MNLYRRLRSFLAALTDRNRFEKRMGDEMRFHIDAYVEDLVSTGVSPDAARRRANIEFGGLEPVKEQCRQARGLKLLDDLTQDLSYGLRSLAKNPGFAATAVVTLALGIGATTAIFSVVYGVLLRPLPFPDSDRIVQIVVNAPSSLIGGGPRRVSLPVDDFIEVRSQAGTLTDLSLYSQQSMTLSGVGDPVRVAASSVSPSMFRLLGASPEMGRLFEASEETPGNDRVVLLSRSAWERRFDSDPQILGRAIRLDDNIHTIVGVMPSDFGFPDAETELWLPFAAEIAPPAEPGRLYLRVAGPAIARLAPDVSIDRATAEIRTIFARLHPPVAPGDAPALGPPAGGPAGGRGLAGRGRGGVPGGAGVPPPGDPFAESRIDLVPIRENMVREVRPALLVLLVSVGFVLMIACVNVANLMLTRAGGRYLEIAIRVALGAGRIRLIRQVMTESVVLAAGGGAVGILIAYVGVRVLSAIEPGWIPRMDEVGLNGPVLAFAVVTSVGTGLLFGLAPGLRLSRMAGSRSLNEGRMHAASGLDLSGRSGMRGVLAAGEVALAIVLLVGGGLLIHSFSNLASVDHGYDPENVLTFSLSLPPARYADRARASVFYEQLLDGIREMPGVEAVGGTSNLPLSPSGTNLVLRIAGTQPIAADMRVVTAGYHETMGIRLIEGRLLTDRDPTGSILVNETFVRDFFPEGALGRELPVMGMTLRVVGVIGDVRQQSVLVSDLRTAEFHIRYEDLQGRGPMLSFPLTLAVRTEGDPSSLVEEVGAALVALDPTLAMEDVRTMEDRLSGSIAEPRFYAIALGIFAAVALVLAAIGIYGVLAYAVSRRTREIGIRMALGAHRGTLVRMVLSQGMTLTLAGVVAGLAGAFVVTRYLENMLFGLTPLDLPTFAGMTGILVLTALVACYLPARRALGTDPLSALRHE